MRIFDRFKKNKAERLEDNFQVKIGRASCRERV